MLAGANTDTKSKFNETQNEKDKQIKDENKSSLLNSIIPDKYTAITH